MTRRHTLSVAAALTLACGALLSVGAGPAAPKPFHTSAAGHVAASPTAPSSRPARAAAPAQKAVPPHRPADYVPSVRTTATSYHGISASVSCATCHTTLPRNRELGQGNAVPAEFHRNLKFSHGDRSCLSCHNGDNYDTLRLADGRSIPFGDAQQLCAQCHGPQTRDYLNGTHGGMTGYWDLSRGGRERNTCTDCHDPHAPAYPVVQPVFAPRDRGARQQALRAEAHAEGASAPAGSDSAHGHTPSAHAP